MKGKIRRKLEELVGRACGDRSLQVKGDGRQVPGDTKRIRKEVAYDAEHADDRAADNDRHVARRRAGFTDL